MLSRGRVGVLFLFLFLEMSRGVDRSKFKKCDELGFCRRNRALASSSLPSPYLLKGTFTSLGHSVVSTIVNQATNVEYTLRIVAYDDNIWRVRVTEKTPLRERFDVAPLSIASEYLDSSKEREIYIGEKGPSISLSSPSLSSTITVDKNSLSFGVRMGEKHLLTINERGLFSFENTRTKESISDSDSTHLTWKVPNINDGAWEESFLSHSDTKPHGPQSIALDVTFHHTKHIFGLPEHTVDFDLPATVAVEGETSKVLREPYRFYNLDVFEYELDETMGLYGAIPYLVSHNEHNTVGFLWVNAAETWVDLNKLENEEKIASHWISETGNVDFFLFLGPSPAQTMKQLVQVSGHMELPPLFSIAYHQCRWNYRDEEDVAQVDAGFDSHDIPMDVMWLDIEHTDGKRYLTWDKAHFPTPVNMQEGLAAKGRKMVTIVDPHLKRDGGYFVHSEAEAAGHYVKDRNGKDFDGWCWPGSSSWLDYLNPTVQAFWASLFSYDRYVGSTPTLYIWNDMNEPSVFNGPEITMQKDNLHHGGYEHREVHNVYGALVHKATRDGLVGRNTPPNERPFVLSRAFFIGSQRYGAIWTGDNAAEWSHLRASQPMLLSLGVAGMSFSGGDVGGFFGNPEPELLLRWYQAGAFQPFFRGHAHLDSKRREPWLFGDPWTSHIRKAIRTRYSYLPYWYTLFHEGSVNGMPMMRPLWMEFPADTSNFGVQDSFMVGSALLVHPIVEAGRSSARVTLPGTKNFWYDVETYESYNGPAHIHVDAPLEKIPVFQRGGTIVPKRERARRSSTQMQWDPYTLVVALDIHGRANGELYVDDGHSYQYTHGIFLHVKFDYTNHVLTCHPVSNHFDDKNAVEKIVIMGIPASKVTQVSLRESKGTTSLTFFASPSTDALIIRKPFTRISESWSIAVIL